MDFKWVQCRLGMGEEFKLLWMKRRDVGCVEWVLQ